MRTTILASMAVATANLAAALPQAVETPATNCTAAAAAAPAAVASRNVIYSRSRLVGTAEFETAIGAAEISLNETVDFVASWMIPSPDGQLFYAVNEFLGKDIRVLEMGSNGTLNEIQKLDGPEGLVSLEFNADKTVLFGASFSTGNVEMFDVDTETGLLSNLRSFHMDGEPAGIGRNQDASRAHQVLRDPTGSFIAVPNLGLDQVAVVGATGNDSKTFDIISTVQTSEPGCGPRHGVFFPQDGEQATHYFLACELINKVEIFTTTYSSDGSVLTLESTGTLVSTYPTEGEFAITPQPEGSENLPAAAEIVLSGDSTHLYVSNRFSGNPTDSIAHFKVTGMQYLERGCDDTVVAVGDVGLELVDFTSTGGTVPRMFSKSADDTVLFVANQGGEKGAVTFSRDPVTGSLTELDGFVANDDINGGEEFGGPQFILEIPPRSA